MLLASLATCADEGDWAFDLLVSRAAPYQDRLASPVGSPERAALVADLAAALPGVLTALGVA